MMRLTLSLAALTSAILRTLVLAWLLRCNARFIRRHWATIGDPGSVRTYIFVLCNLMYLVSWLLHAVTLLIEVLVETLLAKPSPPLSRIIFCEVLGGVCVIGAAFHIALCVVRICDPAIRCILRKWEQEHRDKIHRKLVLILVVCSVPLGAVLIGRFHVAFANFRGEWHYTEVVRGLDTSANLTYGVEFVVCAARNQDSEPNLFSVVGELGIVLVLTGICLIFQFFYEAFHHKPSCATEENSSGWRHVSSQGAYSCRGIVASLPVVTSLWVLFLHPILTRIEISDPEEFYPEIGIHLLLMLSAILVATTHDASQKHSEGDDEV